MPLVSHSLTHSLSLFLALHLSGFSFVSTHLSPLCTTLHSLELLHSFLVSRRILFSFSGVSHSFSLIDFFSGIMLHSFSSAYAQFSAYLRLRFLLPLLLLFVFTTATLLNFLHHSFLSLLHRFLTMVSLDFSAHSLYLHWSFCRSPACSFSAHTLGLGLTLCTCLLWNLPASRFLSLDCCFIYLLFLRFYKIFLLISLWVCVPASLYLLQTLVPHCTLCIDFLVFSLCCTLGLPGSSLLLTTLVLCYGCTALGCTTCSL